ncbi:MAG: YlbF family regulator [Firmicutes bacterium]|nr:YlbF family regulator [Bacillota bacterium]
MNVYDRAHALARAIKESPQLKKYQEAKERLDKDSAAKEMLTDFRKKQMEMQKQKLSGLEISEEQKERLSKLYEIINMNLTVKNFLGAENQLLVMVQDIYKIIGEPLADTLGQGLSPLEKENDEDK